MASALPLWLRRAALPLAAASAFALLKTAALHPAVSDENIYFYMGRLIVEGNIPYRDFFYAGTPLLLYLLAIPAAIAPHSVVAFKLAPLVGASLLVGCFVAALEKAYGRRAALVGFLLLLCSESFLKATSHATGINLAMLGPWAAVCFALARRPGWSGAAWALGMGGKLLAATAAPALLLVVWMETPFRERRRAFVAWGVAAAGVLAVTFLPFAVLAPREMYHGMVEYHFNKLSRPERDLEVWRQALTDNAFLLILAVLAATVWFLKRRERPGSLAPYCIALLAVHFWFLFAQKRMWAFYFDPLIPACAALGAYAASATWAALPSRRRLLPALLAALLAYPMIASLKEYFRHESRYLRSAAPMATYLSQRAPAGAALLGDSTSTPLLALLTGLPIAGNEVDTNGMRFTSGTSSVSAVLDSVSAYPVTYVVANYVPGRRSARVGVGIAGSPEFARLVAGRPSREFVDPGKGTFVIYELFRLPR